MKFLSRQDFLKLGSGYVYMEYIPCIFSDLRIKEDTICDGDINIDFRFRVLSDIDLESSHWHSITSGYKIPIDTEIVNRDGSFDDEILYAVLDDTDLHLIINELSESLKLSKHGLK